jgi:hypothetical protein
MHEHVGFEEKSIVLQFFYVIYHLGEANDAALPSVCVLTVIIIVGHKNKSVFA